MIQFRKDVWSEEETAIEMAFSKNKSDDRKVWLQQYDPRLGIDHNKKTIGYKEFIDRELIHFSNADNFRSIPSMVDGLKPSQRKILYSMFKRLGSGQ